MNILRHIYFTSFLIFNHTFFPIINANKTGNSSFHRVPLNQLPKIENDLLLRSAMNQPTPRVPVWCMRQAGRHLPEFLAISKDHDFFSMCRNPEIAVEVSLQPLDRYGVDAVIIFSDILVIPQAMGMEIQMIKGKGPIFTKPLDVIESWDDINLNPDIEKELGYVLDALNLARQRINGRVPLIGFCGGPFSLLMFMVEGESSKTMKKLKTVLYNHPTKCHSMLKALSEICIKFLIAQQRAGAQVLQVFESVAVENLTQEQYFEFVFPYLDDIATRVKDALRDTETPLIMFSKGTDYALERLAQTKFDCLGLDWTSDPKDVRERIGNEKSLQGNMDPCVIYANESVIESEVGKMLGSFGTRGYIANFGHGCFPDMDPKHVDAFIKGVQQKSLEMNKI